MNQQQRGQPASVPRTVSQAPSTSAVSIHELSHAAVPVGPVQESHDRQELCKRRVYQVSLSPNSSAAQAVRWRQRPLTSEPSYRSIRDR